MLVSKLELLFYFTFYPVHAAVALKPNAALTNTHQHRQPRNGVSLSRALQVVERASPRPAQIFTTIDNGVAVALEPRGLTMGPDARDEEALHNAGDWVDRQHSGTPESNRAFSATSGKGYSVSPVESEGDHARRYHMVAMKGGLGAQRRQADAAYIDGNQTISNDCRTAPVYQIQNESLSIFVSNVQYFYTTNSRVDVQVFSPSLTRGDITQSFRLASSGEVIWRNTAFDNGQAEFCSTDNGTIFAVFRTAARPEGCLTTRLMLFMASSCARLPEYVSTLVQTQSTFIVSTAFRVVVSTEPRTVTTTQREISTYETIFSQTVTSTYQTILAASTVTATATYQTTIPASTATATTILVQTTTQIETSIQQASTITTTYQTTQAASTYITTAVITQAASTITTTYETTRPAVTIVQTVVSTAPTATTTLYGTTTAPPITQTRTLTGTTVTRSVTATTTYAAASIAAPSLCGNQGMEYAVFANNPTYQTSGSGNYNPEFMKARSAGGTWTTRYYNSTYDTISGADNFCPSGESEVGQIYGIQTTFNCREFSIVHRLYMFAYMSGTWRIEVTSIDDQVLTWVGAKAQSGWTKANADTNRYYGQTTSWLWINVVAGQYYPVRIAFGNYGGGASYFAAFYDPTNNVAFTTDTRNSPYILRRSCDGTTAAPFPYLFGEEL